MRIMYYIVEIVFMASFTFKVINGLSRLCRQKREVWVYDAFNFISTLGISMSGFGSINPRVGTVAALYTATLYKAMLSIRLGFLKTFFLAGK